MGEDIAVRLDRLERGYRDLDDLITGDGRISYARSVMGRLDSLEKSMTAAEHLEAAAREVRRTRSRGVSRWLQVTVALCAFVTAASAVIGAVHALTG